MRRLAVLFALLAAAAPEAWAAASPAQRSVQVAKAGLSGAYGAEWETLHPSYKRAVRRARFIACERRSASAIGLIKVTSVVAEGTQVITTTLPLLGDVDVYDVTLLVTYNEGRMRNNMAEIDLFWVLHEGKWVRVFAPAAYTAYKAGKCP